MHPQKFHQKIPGRYFTLLWISFALHCAAGKISAGHPVHGEGSLIIKQIVISGNSVTRDYIIKRELTFVEGDTITRQELGLQMAASRQNLLNTSLFNFVTFTSRDTLGMAYVGVSLIERWYVWPAPLFELTDRNFNSWWKSQDYTRVNYGFRLNWSNVRGRMENLNLVLRSGKNQEFGLIYQFPYIDKGRKWGLGFGGTLIRERERGYLTRDDRLQFLNTHSFLIDRWDAGISVSYRRSLYTIHQLTAGYESLRLSDSLLVSNPEYFYPGYTAPGYLTVFYKVKIDHRDAKYYPLSGWYADLELQKYGLPGGDVDILSVKSTNRLFLPLSAKWYYAGSMTAKWSPGNHQPYYFVRGLGYDREFVRGYEYYVVDGNHFVLNRNSMKFAILPERSSVIPYIPTTKFSKIHYAAYICANLDFGYVWNENPEEVNLLPGTLLTGGGLGLDVVTYYDKVMRIEYSVNKNGESGIFIHFIAGI